MRPFRDEIGMNLDSTLEMEKGEDGETVRTRKCVIVAIAFALGIAPVHATSADVSVTDAWFRALPSGLPAAGYFTLRNSGGAIKLTGANSSACGMLMLHKSENTNGMSSMGDVKSVDVPAGGQVAFAPGGYHLMCMAPAAAMKPGAHLSVTLQFLDGSTKTADFAVRNAAGK
jgi:copper(I)-binding protein